MLERSLPDINIAQGKRGRGVKREGRKRFSDTKRLKQSERFVNYTGSCVPRVTRSV